MPNKEYRELREHQGRPIVDTRKGDRHKPRPPRSGGKTATKWQRRKIVAWDGEGHDIGVSRDREHPAKHIYNLICNSEGAYLSNQNGLSTESVFDFLFAHGDANAINVIYGGSYDVNMILGSLTRQQIFMLWTKGHCFYGKYKIIYNHRKKFTLHRYYMQGKKAKHDEFILWDVLGYFQQTFVSACRKWLGELPILDHIEDMKQKRNTFSEQDFQEVLSYCLTECELLVKLTSALFDAMDEGEIELSRYDGAGSIAAALLRKYKTAPHRGEPTEEALTWARYAYSGGWIEAMKFGNQEDLPIYRNDINSAYPSAAMMLPSYQGASWTIEKEWNGLASSLVEVEWCFDEALYYPLFYRNSDGSIIHPKIGHGIYFGAEVENLERYHKGQYRVIKACNVKLTDHETKPFSFIGEVYMLRLLYKSMGSMASEALKLGMNSIYGKLAQQAGYRNGRIPTYHHLLWAGEITARTRAKLYSASMQHPNSVIAFATDAIISTEQFNLPFGNQLGEWTPELFNGVTMIQPGVYFLQGERTDDNPTGWFDKYRGFDKGAIIRQGVVDSWAKGEESYSAYLTRFVTMGSALSRRDEDFYTYWRTWAQADERKLDLVPGGKRIGVPSVDFATRLCGTLASPNWFYDPGDPTSISAPFKLEWVTDFTAPDRMKIDGVDMRLLEREYEESFA